MRSEQLVVSLIARIRRKANKLIINELKKHNIKGLDTSHGDIIGALFMKNVLTMNGLANIIEKDKSTVTALVNKLANLGYVERVKSEIDNRVTFITLTKKSKALWPVFVNISEKLLSTVYKGFSNTEKDMLIKLLSKIDKNL
ncbi:MAG TPA: MarR family winged helix-turn-helix transcriptional regulator [Candidatus Wunengus sp. YC65]|uniref:MarR family winged helix-turn-helix transcriptional regulator n=1 Tax=Candidatus Wunengus sp. YC65 TaxID=3367701 RepID=UPI004028768A